MDGIHDLGGREGFGRVEVDPNAHPLRGWEARVFAMTQMGFASGVFANVDYFRHAIERMQPAAYLTDGYYGRWLAGLEAALVESGTVPAESVRSPAARPQPDQHGNLPKSRRGARRKAEQPARFAPGDAVRTRTHGVPGHTRLPAYARNVPGRVQSCHGAWVLPDAHAHGLGEAPAHLYTVAFQGEALWGAGAEPGVEVCIDLFEPYLEMP